MSLKKKVLIVALILLDLCLCFLGGQTYSKYKAEVKGEEGAQIAGWNFNVNGESRELKSINLMQTCKQETLTNGKIAPGTSGYFDIIIDASNSEVGIEYQVLFENEKEKPANLTFKYQDKKYNNIDELKNVLVGVINANESEKMKVITIDWQWNYESINNQIDTQDGLNLKNYSFDIIVIGTQMKPCAT